MTTNPMVAFPATAGAAPEGLSPAEIRIAAIWQAVLDIDQAAESAFPERDFFELGGTDAGATEMAERVEAEFGTAFRITSIPPPLTVRAISAHLAEQAFLRARRLFEEGAEFDGLIPTEWGAPEESAMQAVVRDGGPLPLSFAQQRLWFLDQLEPGRAKYLIPLGLRVCGPLDVTALETALTALVARHESLRTRFVADDDGNPGQLVDEPQPVVITLRDLRDLDDARERSEAARRMVDTDAFHPVDLAVGPMLRCILIRLADEEYIVAITVHHIVFDGWSAGILARELPELYTAVVTDRSAELSAPAVQYADFAVWQREWLTGEVLDGQLGYWRERLAHLEPLELPTDRRRPARRSGAGEAITFAVPAELAEQARQAATANGASLFMTLLAVFQVLLSKYSGQEDIAVGTPIAGRNRAEIEDMIGFFVNTLVMRTDLAGDPTFTELLGRVRDTALGAYDHQDLPFERLVEELAPERDLSRNPLFQTMFVLQNVPENHAWALPGLTVEPIGVEAQDAKFDFTCYLTEAADGGLDGMIVYSTELFDEATMVRLAGHFQTLLAEVTGHPDRRLSAADPLTPAERRQILVEWNGDTTEPTDPTPVHRLFEAQAAARPEALAIACGAGTLTYRQLNERANRLAHHLRAHGVGPDAPVAVCLDRGPEMICALLGILKAGAAYVPLDPDYPTERLTYMIEDSDTPLIVTQTTHTPRLPEHTPRILLDHHWWTDTAEDSAGNPMDPVGNPTRSVGPSDLAYTIYTSGSTGRPKGVQIEHGALAARMSETRRELGLTHDDRLLQFASIAFDSSVGQIFAPLTCGAALILREDEWDPTTLAALLRDSRATIAWLTPSAFAALIAQADGPEALGDSLRLVRLGGEALQHEQIRQWFAHSTVPLLNGYGPTEAAQEATTARIERTPEFVPIGRPVANTEVFVVDRHGLPVPVGIAGEIRIGCAGLARGYLNRSDLTREKFTEFEAAGRTRRVYRTGDLAKWHPDGTLEFVGRIDNQVKLRGYRIELGEIEATLLDHPGLTAATVVVREDVPGDKRLIAYVVPTGAVAHEPAGTTPTGELRAHLRRHLPEYMVPAGFVVLDRLPLTPNGKVDRKALPAPDLQRPDLEAAYTAPRTPAEQAVTAIWSDVLGVDTIGIHDNFFELGGHSLLATRVTSRLRKALGVDVPVRTLFSAPTPAELARAVVGMDTDETNRLAPITRDGSPLPLSFAQQRLWFLDQLEPGRAEYLISFALRLTGPFDPTALATAGAALIGRHEVLRTRFAPDDRGLPGQLVSEPGPFIIDTRDLRHIEHRDSREDAARRILDTDGLEPIDLGSGMLLRTLLVRLADDEHILAITVHHIAFDGWSVAVLARELTELYTSAVGAGSAELPVLPMQYADYAVWQREWLTGDVLERQLAHWRATLADLEPLELPTDHRRPAERTGAGEVVTFGVPAAIADRVKAIGAGEGASLFMTLLAVFQVLLSKYSGQEDIAVGTPIAGRNRAEIEDMIGFFVNTLVMRTDLAGDPTFTELLGRVRDTALGAYDHQDLPFERLVEELAPERDLSRNPLFQTMFVLQNAPDGDAWNLPGLRVEPIPTTTHDAKFDLSMYLAEAPDGGLDGAIVYTTDLFDRTTMDHLVGHFSTLLAAASTRPDARLSDLDPLDPAERRRILVEWNDTATDYPDTATIHRLFEERAELSPEAVAVTCGSDTLTYRELNERANRLAHHLRAHHDIAPDTPVGVCLDRSPEMVWALLGILKAGAAYVPLDPDHPADRLAYLVEDTATPLVVTHTSHADRLPAGTAYLALDRDRAAIAGQPADNPVPTAGPHDLSYVIYTSGSTGRPKGVRIEHQGVVNYLAGMQHEFPITEGEGFLQATPLSFDVSAYEIFWPLWRGANVVLVPGSERLDMRHVNGLMREHRIVGLHFVPSLLELFVAEVRAEDCTHLRYAFASGEPLQPTLVSRFVERFPGDLINLYGATEVSVDTTFWRASRIDPLGPVRAGRPMINQTVYVLDRAGRPVPPGVAGEVFLGGASVGRGYHNRPELTAERFVTDPFTGGADARMYRTGDLGRFTPTGDLDLLGRADRQVKLRGVRIELGEVEAMLLTHPTIGSCAVVVREDNPGDKRLTAYCVPAPERTIEVPELRAWCAETLPRALTPAAFVALDALPLTSNGKVDHKTLPAPDGEIGVREVDFVGPEGEIEEEIARLMAEILGVERVGRHESFFELGGHSLLATQLVNRIEMSTGVRVSLRKLFLLPSIAGIKTQLIELFETEDQPSQ